VPAFVDQAALGTFGCFLAIYQQNPATILLRSPTGGWGAGRAIAYLKFITARFRLQTDSGVSLICKVFILEEREILRSAFCVGLGREKRRQAQECHACRDCCQ